MTSRQAAIVGAGPAGLSAAIGFRRSGYDVTVLERRNAPPPRVCGAFLNPEAVQHLKWLDVWDALSDVSIPIRGTHVTFVQGRRLIERWVPNHDDGYGVPRTALESALEERALANGAAVNRGVRVTDVSPCAGNKILLHLTTAQPVHSAGHSETLRVASTVDAVALADGRFSIGDPTLKTQKGWYGWNASFTGVAQAAGQMSLHFYDRGYVGVLTFRDGTTNVCGLVRRAANDDASWQRVFETALEKQPMFQSLLKKAARVGDWHGVGPLAFSMRRRPNLQAFLCGDAAAVGHPFMGEGNARALAAGAMIKAAHPAPDTTTAAALQIYRDEWDAAFSRRLRAGRIARRLLELPGILPPVASLLTSGWAGRHIAPFFQAGFPVETVSS